MPIYEYQCAKCGQVSEVFQRMSDDPLTTCSCGGELKKLMSLNSFHLKGSGWYVTDYGKGNSHGPATAPGDKPASGEAKAAKSETKSEAKSD